MQPGFESATDERTRQLRIDRLVDGGKPAPTDLPHRGKPAERGRERGLIRHSLTAVAILRADLVEQEKQIDLGVVDRVGSGFSPLIRRRSPPDQTVIERCQPIGIGAGLFRLWEWSGGLSSGWGGWHLSRSGSSLNGRHDTLGIRLEPGRCPARRSRRLAHARPCCSTFGPALAPQRLPVDRLGAMTGR